VSDYALLGDMRTAALVSSTGSIDWLCAPRFDSGALFAALLGTPEHGRWLLAPEGEVEGVHRRYVGDSLVVDTEMRSESGRVRVRDCMVIGSEHPMLVRVVTGLAGSVPMRSELVLRFDYGSVVPWVRQERGRLLAVAGPDAVVLASPGSRSRQGSPSGSSSPTTPRTSRHRRSSRPSSWSSAPSGGGARGWAASGRRGHGSLRSGARPSCSRP
jgi:GH15 family glucan-1,4-alpha-glucosidase